MGGAGRSNAETSLVADWLKILDDEIKAGNKMRKQVPKMPTCLLLWLIVMKSI